MNVCLLNMFCKNNFENMSFTNIYWVKCIHTHIELQSYKRHLQYIVYTLLTHKPTHSKLEHISVFYLSEFENMLFLCID